MANGVVEWRRAIARQRDDVDFGPLDAAAFDLLLLDESEPAMLLDPYLSVGGLKNAIDSLSLDWRDQAAGFIGCRHTTGGRAIENPLRACDAERQATEQGVH
jgi:hypothetical protein